VDLRAPDLVCDVKLTIREACIVSGCLKGNGILETMRYYTLTMAEVKRIKAKAERKITLARTYAAVMRCVENDE
jgi:hypothetical protein